MTVEEARALYTLEDNILSMKEAKAIGLVPIAYHTYIRDVCECGSEIATNTALTKQFCVDLNCPLKRAGRAVKTLANFGIKGIGRAYCEAYFRNNVQFKSHLTILYGKRTNYYNTNRIADSDKLMENLYNIRTKGFTFGNLVSRLALPDLGSRANLIFKQFNNFTEFEKHLQDKNITLYKYLINLEGIDAVMARKLEKNINFFSEDLRSITNYFKMKPSAQLHYELCLTGDLDYKGMTKKEFIIYMNMIGEGFIEFTQSEAKMRSDFIISKNANKYIVNENNEVILGSDGNPQIVNYTAKHNIGKERNIQEGRKVLIEPAELYTATSNIVNKLKRGVIKIGTTEEN